MSGPVSACLPWWLRWAQARTPHSAALQLHLGNLYVLPTRAGWLLALVLLVLLVASINFQLNLGYVLTFWLLGCCATSLWWGHRQLQGVRVQLGALAPVFAGQAAAITLQLHSPPGRPCHALSVRLRTTAGPRSLDCGWSHVDLDADTPATVTLTMAATQRGWQPLPVVELESRYPLGVFRLWSRWQPSHALLVYPHLEVPCPPLPSHADAQASAPPLSHAHPGSTQRDDVRPYQRGDALRDVVWKKAAHTLASGRGDLVVRSGHAAPSQQLWLTVASTGVAGLEAQLSRLTAWVLRLHAQHASWGLRLPSGVQVPLGCGEPHVQACLQALALENRPTGPAPGTQHWPSQQAQA